jgi:hypothetical protein
MELYFVKNTNYDEFCLLGYNARHSIESQLTFWRNRSRLQGRRISQERSKQALLTNQYHTGVLFCLFFVPEGGDDMLFLNIGLQNIISQKLELLSHHCEKLKSC